MQHSAAKNALLSNLDSTLPQAKYFCSHTYLLALKVVGFGGGGGDLDAAEAAASSASSAQRKLSAAADCRGWTRRRRRDEEKLPLSLARLL